jgi:hypothetical protein
VFEKILVATDLSDASERVTCSLGEFKTIGTKEVVLLHCLNIRDVGTLRRNLSKRRNRTSENNRNSWRI